jgi:hypothetical protein
VTSPATQVWDCAVGDIDNDGAPDFIGGTAYSSILDYYIGKGDGTFYGGQWVTNQSFAYDVALVDMNNDGKLDAVSSDNQDSLVIVLGAHH